ncbi:MAG: hypothetical protein ACI8ZM_001010 [Crocinitomix sp.]|jgi:hypothetical protein
MSTKRDRIPLKTYFETGDRPTELQFIELIDSILVQTEDDIHGKKDGNGIPSIGIGTPNPKRKLHVAGKTFMSDSGTAQPRVGAGNALEVNAVGTNGIAIVTNKNDVLNFIDDGDPMNAVPFTITDNSGRGFRFFQNVKDGANNGDKMCIFPNGNVGINMAWQAPIAKFEVRGKSEGEGSEGIIKVEGPNKNADANLRFGIVNGSHSWIQAHGAKPLHINGVGNPTYINKSGGNVGIGTTNANEKLTLNGNFLLTGHINGDKSNKPAAQDTLNITNGGTIQLFGEGHDNAPGRVVIASKKDPLNDKSGAILFSKRDSVTGWENNMIIDHDGNVGIGTKSSPVQNRLHIESLGDDRDNTGLTLTGQTGVGPGDILSTDGSGKVKWVPATNVTGELWKKIGTTGNIENGNTGNVGVGTNSPNSKLDIRGDYNDETTQGVVKITGDREDGGPNLRFGIKDGNSSNGYAWLQSHGDIPLKINPHGHPNHVIINEKAGNVRIGNSKGGGGSGSVYSKLEVTGENGIESGHGIMRIQGPKTWDAASVRIGVVTDGSSKERGWIQSHGGPLSLNTVGYNVGIGTDDPNHKLDVNGTINSENALLINGHVPLAIRKYSGKLSDYMSTPFNIKIPTSESGLVYDKAIILSSSHVGMVHYVHTAVEPDNKWYIKASFDFVAHHLFKGTGFDFTIIFAKSGILS